jgi:PKD repeat protein
MKFICSFLSFFILVIHQPTFAQHNHNCGQHIVLKNMLKDSSYKIQFEKEQQLLSANKKFSAFSKGTIYKIPVAFHIVHNNGVEKIDRAQVLDALSILNRDLRALRPDTATVDSIFKPLIADIEVEFVLATKAPDGACFSGITFTESEYSYNNGDINGSDQLDDVINNNDVYQGIWPGNRYLNVLICGAVGAGVAGYAYYPTGTGDSMNWGIWLRHDYCGSIGTGSPSASKTFVHEIGHWLNLPHTWGSTNEPSLLDNCNSDDGVDDTPNTIGSTWCNYNETTCGSPSNIENHMEYSSCRKMFTLGQKERMRTALTSSVGGRANLITSTNHQLTGIDIEPPFCKADFFAENYITCSGDSLFFQDESYHNPISWNWDFEGASPNTAIQKDAYAYYTSPGLFDVSLTASGDSLNYITETKNDKVVVMDYNGLQLPYFEGFENISLSNPEWILTNGSWEITDVASNSGNYCLKVNNLGSIEGTNHILESKTFDLSDSTSAYFSFKYAFAKRNNDNNDKLKILASKDCGKTWSLRKLIQFSQLTTAANQSNFVPSNDEWKQAVVSSIIGPYCVENFRFKFEFVAGGGNDLFIDDINISFENTVNLYEKENSLITIFPNPSSNELNITSPAIINKIKIFDITGKMILEKRHSLSEIKIDIHQLNKGFYTVLIESEMTKVKRRFVKN